MVARLHPEHVGTDRDLGFAVYVVDAIPREDAAVVWGKEQLRIREDLVLLELTYFDQDMQPVRRWSLGVGELSGRVMATRMRMQDVDKPDQYTELEYLDMDFDVDAGPHVHAIFAAVGTQSLIRLAWRNLQRNGPVLG